MLELRILSGYHRGATLPLHGAVLSIGDDDDADVVLADPGLAARHAQLVAEAGSWWLEALEGEVRGDQDNFVQDRILLGNGSFARVGTVWLTLCEADSAWCDPPPEPHDMPAPSLAHEMPGAAGHDDPAAMDEGATQLGLEENAPVPLPASESASAAHRPRSAGRLLIPVVALAVLSGAAAYALTSDPGATAAAPKSGAAARERLRAVSPVLPLVLPPDQLESALRKRLAEIDLLARVTLELEPRQWTIRAALTDEESERLQRMLRNFSQRHVISFPVHVKIGSPESMLPFRISQVMSGADPSIITADGRRLYVGDEYRGVRLAAVAGNQLRFTGKLNLDVVW